MASKNIAVADTGSERLWQSSWLESLPGLLVSPSRGLVWYSPVLVFGFVGAAAVWRNPRYRPLIPLKAASLLLILLAGKWFDWWGGSSWGYRSIVDATPFLALLMIPIIERVICDRRTRVLFAAVLAWSIAVQFVGAYSYNPIGWTRQWIDHDNPDRASLWQWHRPQIVYHVANFATERALKQRLMEASLDISGPILVLPEEE